MSAVDTLLNMSPRLREGMKFGPDSVMVRCPFHGGGNEKTPSLSISLSKPIWFCHGCHTSGHLSQLLRTTGLSREAIDVLLPKNQERTFVKQTLGMKILKTNRDLFRGPYILDEGLLDNYRLCPTSLIQAGFKQSTLRHFEVGYDTRNIRITYPLRNIYGDLVGVSGRAGMEGIEPRYKVYDKELKERTDYNIPPEYSMEAVKSSVLWHGHIVRPLFFPKTHTSEFMVITEGFKACMWTWQMGYVDTVALVGSYLTDHHCELIARVVPKVVLFLDNNEAGWKGTKQAIQKLNSKGVNTLVARYPDERQQPDNLDEDEVADALIHAQTSREWSREHIILVEPRELLRKQKRAAGWQGDKETQ